MYLGSVHDSLAVSPVERTIPSKLHAPFISPYRYLLTSS